MNSPYPIPGATRRWFEAPADRPMLISEGTIWTASECRTASSELAAHVRAQLSPVDDGRLPRVVIYGGANGMTCLAWLGAQLAGAVVTVLDDRLPREWSADFVRRISPQLVLYDRAHERAAAADAPTHARHCYDDILLGSVESLRSGDVDDVGPLAPMTGPATTVYSSGSTGEPKEVLLSHESLGAIAGLDELWGLPGADEVVAVLHPLSMLSGPNVLTGAWRNGRSVVTHDIHRNGFDGLAALLRDHNVTQLLAQTAVVRAILRSADLRTSSLRRIAVGGEPLRGADLELFATTLPVAATVRVVYGMSECPLVASTFVDSSSNVSSGLGFRCHGDVDVKIVDEDGFAVPSGSIGNLLARSPRIADGYIREGRIVHDQFVEIDGERWFRTGDCARVGIDGVLELCGRADARLKVRGNNVYPEAVERALGLLPGVQESVVVGSERPGGGTRLVAYVLASTAPAPSSGDLRRALRRSLPDYCVPAVFVISDILPSLPNGKRDRTLLRTKAAHLPFSNRTEDRPITERERTVERVVADLLGLDEVGVNDDLIDLGMDSLMLAELAVRAAPDARLPLRVATLVRTPTIRAVAAMSADADNATALVQLANGPGPFRFVLVPGAGAAIAYLRPLAARLAGEGEVLAFVAGDEAEVVDEAVQLTSSLALLNEPDRPVVFLGHSWGGLVAHEAAGRLRRARHNVRLLVLLDAAAPPRLRTSRAAARRLVRSFSRAAPAESAFVFDRASASAIGDRRFAASVAAGGRHRAHHSDVEALLLRAIDSGATIDTARWRELVTTLEIAEVRGSHRSVLVEPFLSDVAERISDHLRRTT